MTVNKRTDEGVLYGSALPLLGIGLVLPVLACDSMRTALVLGLVGAASLVGAVALIDRIGVLLPRNSRIGLAAFIGAAITIIAGMAVSLLPPAGAAPYLQIVLFVIPASVLIADAPPAQPGKRPARTLIEAIITGLSFAALLCVSCMVRGLIDRGSAAASANPARFFATVPGMFILLALPAAAVRFVIARRRGVAA
jgi:hypothetical protein